MNNFPKIIPVFPLSNFIIFPKTTVPLNIFEPRYIDMINDSMKSNKIIGMIQPKPLLKKIKFLLLYYFVDQEVLVRHQVQEFLLEKLIITQKKMNCHLIFLSWMLHPIIKLMILEI